MGPLLLIVSLGLVCLVAGAIVRVYLSPLSKIPGPKLSAATLWYECYWDVVKRGQFMWRIQEMHEKYGPIVRINPYEVHILDPDFFTELYASSRKLDKYEWWTKLAGRHASGFATVPHELHRLRRGALNPFFSARSVTALEPLVKAKVDKLCGRFASAAETGEVVRLDAAFMALTMDVICDYSFASDRKYLDEPDFKLLWKETIIGGFEGGAMARHFPWMLPIIERLPLWAVSIMNPAMGHQFRWQAGVKAQVAPILDRTDEASQVGKEGLGRTIFHTLRDSDLPAHEKTLQRLCDEGQILTGAGSETTAQTLTRIMFYLKHAPETLAELRRELDRVVPNASTLPTWSELQQLPYLTAVIKEGLRLSYGVTVRLPRIAHEDIHYKGYTIPAGTPVSQTIYFVLMHPSIFPEPAEFRPQRWIDAGGSLDKYLVSFGKGTRQCLGMNLAYAELYLAVASVVRQFDWDMYETGLDDIVCKHDFFVAVADLDSKGVRARLVTRKK